jgi:hypothetical protein
MDGIDLVRMLREVPPFRPRLIELTWKAVGEDGALDINKVTFYAKEITEAIEEAHAYAKDTKEMVRCLRRMAHSQS